MRLEDESSGKKALMVLSENKEVAVLLAAGVVMVLMGIKEWQRVKTPESVVEVIEEPDSGGVIGGVVVDISGAVERPGVYRLSNEARVGEALEAAGGLREDADADWVAKNVNLAAVLEDGKKVFVPMVGEIGVGETAESEGVVAGVATVNINSASESALDGLPGIGPARAKAIIDNRPYGSTDELVSKDVLSQSVFEGIEDQVSVY